MNHTHNPTRRNRNIGTTKQGFGQNNQMTIPQPLDTLKTFYERFSSIETQTITVHSKEIPVIIENLKDGYYYSCTPFDIERIMRNLPAADLEDFGVLIFRQPKKKEKIISSVWGRLIYSYEYNDDYYPAIIIEAVEHSTKFRFPKKQSVEDKNEFDLLKKDGLSFVLGKREHIAEITPEKVRNIQLYRTLLHEIGHYNHYLEVVERPGTEDEDFEMWEKRNDFYFSIKQNEKEVFANKYAARVKSSLTDKGVIPFKKIK